MMLNRNSDTIAAIATPMGRSAIGIVRMSGPKAFDILRSVFLPLPEKLSRGMYYGRICDEENNLIDDALALVFECPHSYTGDDLVEFSCHGNPVILQEVLGLVLRKGARLADRGEFTMRAFLNGKLDLTQAEGVRNVIDARSITEASLSVRNIHGALSDMFKEWLNVLNSVSVQIEAMVEFPEEESSPHQIDFCDSINGLITQIEAFVERGRVCRNAAALHTVLIVGKPNVGKSSLFNAILNQDRSLVYHEACTTRDMVCEQIDVALSGKRFSVKLCDTAGIIDTAQGIDAIAIEKVFEQISQGDMAIFVLEAGAVPDEQEMKILKTIQDYDLKTIVFINKIDLSNPCFSEDIFGNAKIIKGSAKNRQGIKEILQAISDEIPSLPFGRAFLLSVRQESVLLELLKKMKEFSMHLAGDNLDIAADVLHEARALLSGLLNTEVQAVITEIFNNFCIGK